MIPSWAVWLMCVPAYLYFASRVGAVLARNDELAATPEPRHFAGDDAPTVRDEMAELHAWDDSFPACPACQPIRRVG